MSGAHPVAVRASDVIACCASWAEVAVLFGLPEVVVLRQHHYLWGFL